MELSWSDVEVPLTSFLERFNLPQIVQVMNDIFKCDVYNIDHSSLFTFVLFESIAQPRPPFDGKIAHAW